MGITVMGITPAGEDSLPARIMSARREDMNEYFLVDMIRKVYWEVGLDWDAKLKSHDMEYRSRDLEMDNGECYQRCEIEKKIIIIWRVPTAVAIGYEKIHHLEEMDL